MKIALSPKIVAGDSAVAELNAQLRSCCCGSFFVVLFCGSTGGRTESGAEHPTISWPFAEFTSIRLVAFGFFFLEVAALSHTGPYFLNNDGTAIYQQQSWHTVAYHHNIAAAIPEHRLFESF
jgi:hypothetical protein